MFITRLHVRYTRDKFPEDLIFQQTANRQQHQGRYVIRHPYTGPDRCAASISYQRNLRGRMEQRAQTLARLTGWNIDDIRRKMTWMESGSRPIIGW
ncbi:hypothetical protein [cf. Phormidesmis sp. LEGE 11477]|uniref:hypothetical protein n=1 Tax=cf. Phormidesmis sp. LEGE 11477 TaxID=1828680 RepID=UPI00351D8F3F